MSTQELPVSVTFLAEADEILQNLEGELEAIGDASDQAETVAALFRNAHTLKGSALVAGLRPVGELAHVLEELFSRWRDGKLAPTLPQVTWARQSLDMLREVLRAEASGASGDGRGAADASDADKGTFLRVELDKLNALADTIGEIALARARERALLAKLPFEHRIELSHAYEATERHYVDLHERSLRLRLVSFAPLFAALTRAAQQVAKKIGKALVVTASGAELEVDAAIVANLKDPLLHMIRNAVDHGIEAPAQRSAAGKSEAGLVRLSARRIGGHVIVELSDDGKGLDRQRILDKAREQGRALTLADLTDETMASLIFEPGFSTANQVTDVSGRGVGMDVVRSNVQQMRGRISVRSTPGQGATFEIQVPLALAIVQGFHVMVGDSCFVLPAECVERCLDAPAVSLVDAPGGGADCIRYQGRLVPLLALGRALGYANKGQGRQPAVVVRSGNELIAFRVDALGGEHQTVVRPLGPMFASIQPVSGATVLGNGEVALLLDVPRVVTEARQRLLS
jgi:two-component system chemotaxis sensor kinase CheA